MFRGGCFMKWVNRKAKKTHSQLSNFFLRFSGSLRSEDTLLSSTFGFFRKKVNLLEYPSRLSSVLGTLRLISRLLLKTAIHTFSTFVNKFKCQSHSIIYTTLTFKPQSKETSKHNTSQLDEHKFA